VARLTENELNQKRTLDISRERLLRAKYGFDYGQNTQLDVLNAEVDYNTDSISYLTIVQQLENQKRNLNLLLGRDVEIIYDVDTSLTYDENLEFQSLKEKSEINNVFILLSQSSLRNAEYNIKSTSAARIPRLGVSASYGANFSNLGPTSFVDRQSLLGPSVGATLSWNIFDGGTTNIRRQNSKINLENQEVALEQEKLNLSRNLSNAWNIYKTALFVMEAERMNLRTNQRNFDRTVEQYGLGQITQIVFRQAQLNLLTAELNYNRAKYSAKIAELALFQLSGDLMDADF
jgi:outer membrane protein TolC